MPEDASISLIVTVHAGDRPEYLREALASAAGQTLRPSEVVVVADGPLTDEQEVVCTRVREDGLPLAAVRLDENRGPAAARNAGVSAASGTYAAFLDADDRCGTERLQRQRFFLEQTGVDVAGSWCRLLDAKGDFIGVKQTPVSPDALRRYACLFNPIVQSSVFGKREVFLMYPYPEGPRSPGAAFDGEDYALWVSMLSAGVQIANVPAPLVDYRMGEAFAARRRGLGPFRTDWATKRRALALQPAGWRVAGAPIAFLTACTRLLPTRFLRGFYAVRNAWRFEGQWGE